MPGPRRSARDLLFYPVAGATLPLGSPCTLKSGCIGRALSRGHSAWVGSSLASFALDLRDKCPLSGPCTLPLAIPDQTRRAQVVRALGEGADETRPRCGLCLKLEGPEGPAHTRVHPSSPGQEVPRDWGECLSKRGRVCVHWPRVLCVVIKIALRADPSYRTQS